MKVHYFIVILLLLSIGAGCAKKQEAPRSDASEADASEPAGKIQCGNEEYDAYKGWICLNGVLRCFDKNGCRYGEKTAPMRSALVGNAVQEAEDIQVLPCEPTHTMPGTTCKDGNVYCGEAVYPGAESGDWHCVQGQWLCVGEFCSCGDRKTRKFGTCKDGVPYCGDKEMVAPKDKGFVCQDGKWVCATSDGCGKCAQFQTLDDKGNCEGDVAEPLVKRVECDKGNCPCGDGACPKDGACLTVPGKPPICICGDYLDDHDCADDVKMPVYSNKYGEFTCDYCTIDSALVHKELWYLKCENKNGCHIQGEKEVWKPTLEFETESACNEDAFEAQAEEPEKYHLVKGDDYNAALKEAELSKHGRKSALEFEQTGPEWLRTRNSKIDSVMVRSVCDVTPVPPADRKNFTCDILPEKPFRCFSWIAFDMQPVGLRCKADSGCTCYNETCAKGQLCVDGVCRYDTAYAHNICENVYPHLAPDEPSRTEKEIGGMCDAVGGIIHIYSPSDGRYDEFGDYSIEIDPEGCHFENAYDIAQRVFLWDKYSTDVSHKLVTPNGTCMCGNSVVTPAKLSDYKCVQSLGYVCINPNGCACGNAKCKSGALCLREGVCSSVVMEKGLAPEKITNDKKCTGR